jgi:hypothetical protein
MTLLLGKKPATYDRRDFRYADARAGLDLPTPQLRDFLAL